MQAPSRKRKREDRASTKLNGPKSTKVDKITDLGSAQARILLWEEQILDSREHYGNISKLQDLSNDDENQPRTASFAAVALCRVFCRLIAGDYLVKRRGASDEDAKAAQFLKHQLREYVRTVANWIGCPDATKESTALTLLMRIVKEEVLQESARAEQAWRTPTSTFFALIKRLLDISDAEGARHEFVEKYVEAHDDVRFYAFSAIRQCFTKEANQNNERAGNAIDLLAQIEGIPESQEQLQDWYGAPPGSPKHALLSHQAHRKQAQEAWLAVFRTPLTHDQRKRILNIMAAQVLPWFSSKMEILTDFLTDSFNSGGGTALLALSGVFHLMTQRNIDYPDFYIKLYSLLDNDVLHSKHRSRFFRLLDVFMASTHLPAAMVASFIKRLSRLALQAPPGALVCIVPLTYNLLRRHPSCTFMLHRPHHPAHAIYASNPEYADSGMHDPFDMCQPDPALTGAIDSSLWELEALRSHYHPNVATLAKILGEQFTKREYQLEDFLDHSYASLVQAELGKELKKAPVVEWEIPKRIVTREDRDGLNALGSLLETAIAAS